MTNKVRAEHDPSQGPEPGQDKILNRARGKMARRLVRLCLLLTILPLILTVAALEGVAREQILWTARIMQQIEQRAVGEAGLTFQRLGKDAILRSGDQARETSIAAVQGASEQVTRLQASTLDATAHTFTHLTTGSLDSALRESRTAHRSSLSEIHSQMTQQLAQATRETQRQAAGNIQRAMFSLNDTLMHERARRLVDRLRDRIEAALNYLRFSAQMLDMHADHAQARKETLDALVRRLPEFRIVSALDLKGQEIAMSVSDRLVTEADLGRYPDAAYFRTAVRGGSYVARATVLSENGMPMLRLAAPIELYRGKVVGVLAARYALDDLWDEIRTTRIGREGFAFVMDEAGRPLISPRPSPRGALSCEETLTTLNWRVVTVLPRSEAMQPVQALYEDIATGSRRALDRMRHEIDTASGRTAANLERAGQVIRAQTVERLQRGTHQALRSVQQQSLQQMQAQMKQMRQSIQVQTRRTQRESARDMALAAQTASHGLTKRIQPLLREAMQRANGRLALLATLIALLFGAVSSLLALLTAGRIVRPVTLLAEVARDIAHGDLNRRVDENAPDEIGDLASAFNTMADSLQQSRTELHDAEGQLVQSAKLAALGTLSAGVAHELNQPLAVIRGVTQQLTDEEGLSEEVKADLTLIEGQTSRMVKIIRHLRTFCRADSGEMRPVDVNQVVEDCFILVGAQLRSHNIEVVMDLCPQSPLVMADQNELEQVFLNLITNARDALEGRPSASITIHSRQELGQFHIEFKDNGTGIPDTVLSRIFDPFFTTKDPGKGTGLGLSISHSIIKKHKGTLTARNDVGAVFSIALPLFEETPELARAA